MRDQDNRPVSTDEQEKNDAEWRKVLIDGHRPSIFVRHVFRRLPSEPRCKFCQNPFGGVGGRFVGLFGFTPSRKNPNLCKQCCEGMPPGGAEIDIAILFADVRGSTAIAEGMTSGEFAALMNRFYAAATRALIRHDAIIDKLVGDEVMALFIPGIAGEEYKEHAVDAAQDLMRAVRESVPELSIGVGIHSGTAFVGSVGGEDVTDFTALGDPVNTAARLQGVAEAGQIAMTDALYEAVRDRYPEAEERSVFLRGKQESIALHVLSV